MSKFLPYLPKQHQDSISSQVSIHEENLETERNPILLEDEEDFVISSHSIECLQKYENKASNKEEEKIPKITNEEVQF